MTVVQLRFFGVCGLDVWVARVTVQQPDPHGSDIRLGA